MIVLHKDAKKVLRYCSKGMRAFFGRHGLDYLHFVRNGIEASKLPQDDSMVKAVIQQAELRLNNDG